MKKIVFAACSLLAFCASAHALDLSREPILQVLSYVQQRDAIGLHAAKQRGLDVDAVDSLNRTALCFSVMAGSPQPKIRFLIKRNDLLLTSHGTAVLLKRVKFV